MESDKMNQYDQFSLDYHWLYSDSVLAGKSVLAQLGNLLDSIPPDSKLLDCSCGIGTQSIVLAQHGFSVVGTDSSPGMIAQARERAKSAGMKIPFSIATWQELPKTFEQKLDVAFCLGNSIGHCKDKQEIISSFQGIHAVLKKDGIFVLDSRNWEKLRNDSPRFTTMGCRVRNGVRCYPLYVWNFSLLPEEKHVIDVVLIFDDQKGVYERHYSIVYHPFRYTELCDYLSHAGFADIRSDFAEDKGLYTITARAK